MEKLEIDKEFWKNKRVLVTGHTGFKGGWLTIWLKKLGSEITGFSKDIPTNPSLFELADVKNGIDSIIGDIRNYDEIKKVIENKKPEIIFHLAAQSLVPFSYSNPKETYETNIMGVVNLLEAVRNSKNIRAVLNVTSDKCYENKELERGYVEDDQLGGHDPYSNSKGCSELVTRAFKKSYFNPVKYDEHQVSIATARSGNVIGGGDWAENRLIPDLMRSITNNMPVKIRNPNGIRPWQYVLEPLNGYLLLIQRMWSNGKEFSEEWNFGPNEEEKPVSWIVNKISEFYKIKFNTSTEKNGNIHETKSLRLDCTKAHSRLYWKPKTNLEQGLQMTIDWYKNYKNQNNMKEFTENQIDQFVLK